MKVRPFFLNENSKSIYCVEYTPDQSQAEGVGVLLCKPIWGERIRTHRIFANLAVMLCEKGYHVATCDYFGDGNSGGETVDLSFESMVDDICMLNNDFSRRNSIASLTVIGLLIGANVAIEAEKHLPNLSRLLLFEPLRDPIEAFKRALRANLSSQMVRFKKVIKNRESLIEDLHNDIPVNIDGFVIGKKFWESFERASPLRIDSQFEGRVHVYSMMDKRGKGSDFQDIADAYQNGKFDCVEKEFIWTDWKTYIPKPKQFFKVIKDGLQDERNVYRCA